MSLTKSFFKWPNFSPQKNLVASAPQGFVLGLLLFSVYTNDLPNGRTSMSKTFADNTSLFSKVNNEINSKTYLKSDLEKISKWYFQWKMPLSLDKNKQAIEVGFSNNRDKEDYLPLMFSCTNVQLVDSQKSLGLTLNLKNKF